MFPCCPGEAPCPAHRKRRTRKVIEDRLGEASGDIEQALASANSAHVAFIELTREHLFDADLAETAAGDDAVAKLLRVMADLRDVARIIELRQLRGKHGEQEG